MNNLKITLGAIGATAVLASVIAVPVQSSASPEFLAYEGRNAVHEGQGGEKKVVGAIDFWFNGDPPHRFKVLGSISDRRMKTGIYGMIRMSGLDTDIAKVANAAGGDAVIMQSEGDDVLGISGFGDTYASGSAGGGSFNASSFGSAIVKPIKAHVSRYIVIKYLPDLPPPSAPVSAATASTSTVPSAVLP